MENSLRIQRDRLALEAFAGADVKTLLTVDLPQLVIGVKSFFNRFAPTDPALKLTNKQQAFVKEVSKHPYMDIAPLAAFVPEGLDVTYTKYSAHLLNAAIHASRILSGPLSAYSVFLSQLISNKDQQMSTASMDKAYKTLAKQRDEINEELGSCFKKGSTRSEVTLGDVIARNSDWPNVFQNSTHILNLVNEVDRKALNKKIAECVSLLDKIMELAARDEFKNMSPEMMTGLSNGAYEIASELEFFAVTYYKADVFANSVNRTVEHFHDVFNKK